jgi:hypothetical protein
MDNLFPGFRTFSIEPQDGPDDLPRTTGWDPARVGRDRDGTSDRRAFNNDRSVPRLTQPRSTKRLQPPRPRPAPNDRDKGFVLEEASPLCAAQRGVADPVRIVGPKVLKEKHRQTKEEEHDLLRVILNIFNRVPISLEIFSHAQATVHSIELKEDEECFRIASSLKPYDQAETLEANVLPVFLSTPKIGAVNMSSRQEIKDFHFNPGPIGLVVELMGMRLMCTKTMPNSQCSFHEQAIVGSEVIAVNGKRVLTLQTFVEEIAKAQHLKDRFIDIRVTAFKGGRMKLDDMMSFSKKNKKMTSLLGNMFTKGMDKDHSHGIELPAAREESSSEEEEEEVASEDEGGGGEDGGGEGEGDKPPTPGTPARAPTEEEQLDEEQLEGEEELQRVESIDGSKQSSRGSSHRSSRVNNNNSKGAVLDDNSSMGSSTTKKKFMQVYRGDSDDESLEDQGSLLQKTENNSIDSFDEHNSIRAENGLSRSPTFASAEGFEEEDAAADPVAASGTASGAASGSELAGEGEGEAAGKNAEAPGEVREPKPVSTQHSAEQGQEPASGSGSVPVTAGDDDDDDDDDDGDAAINEELIAKFRSQGIGNALEEMATGEDVPVVLEEEPAEEEDSDAESEAGDVWDYATVLEGQDYSPFRALVCMPKSLEKSPKVRL